MKIVSVEQMRQLEKAADGAGVSYAQMMEAAGRAVAEAIARRLDVAGKQILVLAGPGNNGGDGLVAARYLHDFGARVTLYLWNRRTENDANFALAQERHIVVVRAVDDAGLPALRNCLAAGQIVVDALLGTGANRPIEGLLADILTTVRSSLSASGRLSSGLQSVIPDFQLPGSSIERAFVVAVDLPSGVNADSGAVDPCTVPAALTVTFACPKIGFFAFPAADALGELLVADIGIPSQFTGGLALNLATASAVRSLLPPRPRSGHKGTFGKAMIASGGANYTGAPYLSAAAATRAGAGLVTLATTGDVQRIVAAGLHEPTYLPLPAVAGGIAARASSVVLDALEAYDALLVGPGLGRAQGTQRFVYRLLGLDGGRLARRAPLPRLIVDADGLNALSERARWWDGMPALSVLTPHSGEFARLSKLSTGEVSADRIGCAAACARQWNQVVLLKGAFTAVAEPGGQVTLLPFANPALATAGSGDVLSGIIVGLMAQGLAPLDAAIAGGYVHGMAGELARRAIGDAGVVAGDLLLRIPEVIRGLKLERLGPPLSRDSAGPSANEKPARS